MHHPNATQAMPELAGRNDGPSFPVAMKMRSVSDQRFSVAAAIEPHPLSLTSNDCTRPDKCVKVFCYVGTPSPQIGTNGDFYLEEETNVLYGPKVSGVWPENGTRVTGSTIRKRTRDVQTSWSIDLDEFKASLQQRRALRRRNTFWRVASCTVSWLFLPVFNVAKFLLMQRPGRHRE